ncbi:MAG: hypothetical protein V4704_00775 [Pseudomonadota bacterium]
MRLPEFVWKQPLLVAATAGSLLGVVLGVLWPLPSPAASGAVEDAMRVPARAAMERYSEGDFAVLRDGRLWTGSAVAQAGSATVATWRLLGVVTGPARAALVEAGGKQVSVGVGQPLPDGTILRSVSAEAIGFERNACLFQRALYSKEDVPIATAKCPAANNTPTQSTPNQ